MAWWKATADMFCGSSMPHTNESSGSMDQVGQSRLHPCKSSLKTSWSPVVVCLTRCNTCAKSFRTSGVFFARMKPELMSSECSSGMNTRSVGIDAFRNAAAGSKSCTSTSTKSCSWSSGASRRSSS